MISSGTSGRGGSPGTAASPKLSTTTSAQSRLKFPSRPGAGNQMGFVLPPPPLPAASVVSAATKSPSSSLSTSALSPGVPTKTAPALSVAGTATMNPAPAASAKPAAPSKTEGTHQAVQFDNLSDELEEQKKLFRKEKETVMKHLNAVIAEKTLRSESLLQELQASKEEAAARGRHASQQVTALQQELAQAKAVKAVSKDASAATEPMPSVRSTEARIAVSSIGTATENKIIAHDDDDDDAGRRGAAAAARGMDCVCETALSMAAVAELESSVQTLLQQRKNYSIEVEQLRMELVTLHHVAEEAFHKVEATNRLAAENIEKFEVSKKENKIIQDMLEFNKSQGHQERKLLETSIALLREEINQMKKLQREEDAKRAKLGGVDLFAALQELQKQYEQLRDNYYQKTSQLEQENRLLKSAVGDTFEEVMMSELKAMRAAYEAKIDGMKEEQQRVQLDHARTLAALQDTFKAERRVLEGRLRQYKVKLEHFEAADG